MPNKTTAGEFQDPGIVLAATQRNLRLITFSVEDFEIEFDAILLAIIYLTADHI